MKEFCSQNFGQNVMPLDNEDKNNTQTIVFTHNICTLVPFCFCLYFGFIVGLLQNLSLYVAYSLSEYVTEKNMKCY